MLDHVAAPGTRRASHRADVSASAAHRSALVVAVVAFGIVEPASRSVFFDFGDILLTFFLAWLLAFISARSSAGSSTAIPRLPRAAGAVILVYIAVVVVLVLVVVVAGAAPLATSIGQFSRTRSRTSSEPAGDPRAVAGRGSTALGLRQVDLVAQARRGPRQPRPDAPAQLVGPLQRSRSRASASFGTLLIVVVPVDLHGRRPRRRSWPSCSGSSRRRYVGRGAPARDVASRGRSAASCAARRSWASSTGPDRARSRTSCSGCRYAAAHHGRRRAAPDDPVLRAVRRRGCRRSSSRSCPQARRRSLPGDHPDGRRLVRRR